MAVHGEAGGLFGEGPTVWDGDTAVAGLDHAVALEFAYDLRDGLAGRGDHVHQVLVRQAHVDEHALAEALAQVHEQRRQAGRDLPVQGALYDLVGLPETLGEQGIELVVGVSRGEDRVLRREPALSKLSRSNPSGALVAAKPLVLRLVSIRPFYLSGEAAL
jgi:hypothetical protein